MIRMLDIGKRFTSTHDIMSNSAIDIGLRVHPMLFSQNLLWVDQANRNGPVYTKCRSFDGNVAYQIPAGWDTDPILVLWHVLTSEIDEV